MGRYRVTIQEAAERLGVKETAVRKRIERGTLQKEKAGDGRVYVFVDAPPTGERDTSNDSGYDATHPAGYDALISEMRGRLEDLRTQLEAERQAHSEARRLLAAALERIPPQLEAPTDSTADAPGSPESGAEEAERAEPPRSGTGGAQEGAEMPWWRRVFGG